MSSEKSDATVHAAAASPLEWDFLSAIVADPADASCKLVYADWLDEQGDPRAEFVRRFAAACQSLEAGCKFPNTDSLPRSWVNMLSVPLFAGIVEHDLIDVMDEVLSVARPMLLLQTEPLKDGNCRVGSSKFGGRPDLPASTPWPRSRLGPLGFLGQFAMQDLQHTQAARKFPSDGLLSFFANHQSGYQPGKHFANYQSGYHPTTEMAEDAVVLYSPAQTRLIRREPHGLHEENSFPECRLEMTEAWDVPDSHDEMLPSAEAAAMHRIRQSNHGDGLDELRQKLCHCDRNKQGGTWWQIGHHLLGYACHFRGGGHVSPGPGWTDLLCLASDDKLFWNWCDCDHLAIYVHDDDLRNASFARAFGYAS